jgi:hypothetical protein
MWKLSPQDHSPQPKTTNNPSSFPFPTKIPSYLKYLNKVHQLPKKCKTLIFSQLHFLLIVQQSEVIDILWHQSNQKFYIRNQGMKMIHDKSLQSNLGIFSNKIETQFIS